jgi:hypothetical protein
MSKRKTRPNPTSASESPAHRDGAVLLCTRIAMPEFGEEAIRFLEESRRLVSRSRSMERVGGSRFRRSDKETRPL